MAYTMHIGENAGAFSYNGVIYYPGDTTSEMDACDMKGLMAAFQAKNPDITLKAAQKTIDSLEEECPMVIVKANPRSAPVTAPVEANPSATGGDSAEQLAAPAPPVGGELSPAPSKTDPAADGNTGDPALSEEPTRPPEGEPHPTHGDEQPRIRTHAGEPVDIFSGVFYLEETDLEIPNTILPLSLVRMYRSGAASFGPFGWNWDHNYNLFVRELYSGDIALWRNLHEDIFKFNGAGFDPPTGIFEKLERIAGQVQVYEIHAEEGFVIRFERPSGWLDGERIPVLKMADRHGNSLHFSYNQEDKLAEVRDDEGHSLYLEYDRCGLLVAVSDQSGRKYGYRHDEQTQQLIRVTFPSTTDHPAGTGKIFYYAQPWLPSELRHNIVRIEDSEGNVYLENTYEQDPSLWNYGRVTEQLYGGYLYQYRYTPLQYVPAGAEWLNMPAVRVEVMNPDFGLEVYTFNYRGDLLDKRFRLSRDGSYRVVVWQYQFDTQGSLSVITRPDGSQEISTFDVNHPDPRMRGRLMQKEITSASGFPAPGRIIWKGKYEPVYQLLTQEISENGATTQYRYDFHVNPGKPGNTGKLVKIIHPVVALPDGTLQASETLYDHTAKGQLLSVVLPDGTRNEWKYGVSATEAGRPVARIFDSAGLNVENRFSYDSFGYRSGFTDGNGYATLYEYNALGLPEKTILPGVNGTSAEFRFHYDQDRKQISSERPKGNPDNLFAGTHIIDEFERDVLGFPVRYTLSSNTSEKRTFRICSDFRGNAEQVVNPDGTKMKRVCDERGLILSEEIEGSDGSRISTKKVYDRAGRVVLYINTNGLETRYEYDGYSRIRKITFPNATSVTYQWLKGDLTGSEEVEGDDGIGTRRILSRKTFTYDEKGRKITETVKVFEDDPSASIELTTTFFYNKMNLIEKISDCRGGSRKFSYDGMGRLIKETDPEKNERHDQYDAANNLIRTDSFHQEPDGSVSVVTKKFAYDERNRKTSVIEPDGARITFEYDDMDLIVRQTDYNGIVHETAYDTHHNRVSETHDVNGSKITHKWTWDSMSRVTSYTDPAGQVSRYHFDRMGRAVRTGYPTGFSSHRQLNEKGQIVTEILGSGVRFDYHYDQANRLVRILNPSSPAAISPLAIQEFKYDGMNRLISARSGGNEIARRYDSLGRLLSESAFGNEIRCRYDDMVGSVEKIWPDGRTEKYLHNLNGMLRAITETVHSSMGEGANLIASFGCSGNAYFAGAEFQGGLKQSNIYDERKRMTEMSFQSPPGLNEEIGYRYTKSNRIEVEAISGKNPELTFYEFDHLNRLVRARNGFSVAIPSAKTQNEHDNAISVVRMAALGAAHEEKFGYNDAGERISYNGTGNQAKNYAYEAGHRIWHDGTDMYTHDEDGTRRSAGQLTYETDALGRITFARSGMNEIFRITYDALGRPCAVREAGKPERTFNYFGSFIEQERENGILFRHYSRLPVTGVPVAFHSPSKTLYTLFDNRYNLTALADTEGNLLESYRYRSFGEPRIFTPAGAGLQTSAYGIEPVFGGQRYLSSGGVYLSKKRLMDSVNGIFLSPDPKGYEDAASLYAYAALDPVNHIDPNGEAVPLIVAAAVIIGALAGAGLSIYDAWNHPEKYEGAANVWRPMAYTFGGGAIGAIAVYGSEAVMSVAGAGTLTGATGLEAFLAGGTQSALTGYYGRAGFSAMFPEYVDPPDLFSVATDYLTGGTFPGSGTGLRAGLSEMGAVNNEASSAAGQMLKRAWGGNWRFFGNTWKMLRNPRIQYNLKQIFWNPKSFESVSKQYWRVSRGADGKALHHLLFQNQSKWIPQGLRNAGFNLLEIPGPLNTWMGGQLGRELAFRGTVLSVLAGTGIASFKSADWLLQQITEEGAAADAAPKTFENTDFQAEDREGKK
jgi:RHS repeat-associated protein